MGVVSLPKPFTRRPVAGLGKRLRIPGRDHALVSFMVGKSGKVPNIDIHIRRPIGHHSVNLKVDLDCPLHQVEAFRKAD